MTDPDAEISTSSKEEKSNKFSLRNSPTKKETLDSIESVRSTNFVPVRLEHEMTQTMIGFSDLFFQFLRSPEFLRGFCELVSTAKLSQTYFVGYLAPFLCSKFQHNEALTKRFTKFLWNKTLTQGSISIPVNTNATRVAFIRIHGEFSEFVDDLDKAQDFAENLRNSRFCHTQLLHFQCLCDMLLKSGTVQFPFFKFVDKLKGQLAETLSMNFSFGESFDLVQETLDMFVRNQFLQFAKRNHHSTADSPRRAETVLILAEPIQSQSSDLITACTHSATDVYNQVYGNFKLYGILRAAALTAITSSESRVSKTDLRKWANQVLVSEKVVIKNTYHPVFCKLLNFLGTHFEFSVRGTYQYPIFIEGLEKGPARLPRVRKTALPSNNPVATVNELDARIIVAENALTQLKQAKRALEDTEAFQELSKRQRSMGEDASED